MFDVRSFQRFPKNATMGCQVRRWRKGCCRRRSQRHVHHIVRNRGAEHEDDYTRSSGSAAVKAGT